MTDQFKNDQMDESREKDYIAEAFDRHYADQLDKDLQKHGIYRTKPGMAVRYLRPLIAVAASVALVVFGWLSYRTTTPDAMTMADNYITQTRIDYAGEVRKGAGTTADEGDWAMVMELYKSGDYEGAAQAIRSLPSAAATEAPEKRDFYMGLCAMLQPQPDFQDAATALTAARKKATDPRDCDWLLALVYLKLDQKENAAAALSRLEVAEGTFRKKDVKKLKEGL